MILVVGLLFPTTTFTSVVNAFAPAVRTVVHQHQHQHVKSLHLLPPSSDWILSDAITAPASRDYGELAKSAGIVLVLGGGLIPALVQANSGMMKTLSGRKGENLAADPDPQNTFDPTVGDPRADPYRRYVYDSGASGPDLPQSELLFSADRIPLVDVIAVLGRIQSTPQLVDWRNLPSAKRGQVANTSNPPMWLPRQAFKVLIRRAPWNGWPVDPTTGEPVGGTELQKREEPRLRKKDVMIGDAALDAVFDAWSWGASVATPDKVEATLQLFRPRPGTLDLNQFCAAAVRGRSNTAIAAASFVVIQLIVFGSLFVRPLLDFFAEGTS